MVVRLRHVDQTCFNPAPVLPYELRIIDFVSAMQDIYDFFYDVNMHLVNKGLQRLDDMMRPAMCSGIISDTLTASLAKHSRALRENGYFNGHPDLVVQGRYANDSVKAGEYGVEIKSTKKTGGAVDFHGARKQWLATFVYEVDTKTEPASDRLPMRFREVYLGQVVPDDFRHNDRGELGTRTATLDKDGLAKYRQHWVYMDRSPFTSDLFYPRLPAIELAWESHSWRYLQSAGLARSRCFHSRRPQPRQA